MIPKLVDENDIPGPARTMDLEESRRQTLAYLQLITGAKTPEEAAKVPMVWRLVHPQATLYAQVLVGTYADLQRRLQLANLAQGYGIFAVTNLVTPWRGEEGRDHVYENCVTAARALYADIDAKLSDTPLTPRKVLDSCTIPPTMAVHTGHGLHLYWVAREPQPLPTDEALTRQKGVLLTVVKSLAHVGADKAFTSLAQAPRVPGFLNTKSWPCPMVHMLRLASAPLYTWTSLERAFPPDTLARFWSKSFKIEEATGVRFEDLSEAQQDEVYRVTDEYDGGPVDSGHGCSGQIMSCAARLLRMGLHPDAVEELVEEEVNAYVIPPYPDVGRKVAEAWRRFQRERLVALEQEAELDLINGIED